MVSRVGECTPRAEWSPDTWDGRTFLVSTPADHVHTAMNVVTVPIPDGCVLYVDPPFTEVFIVSSDVTGSDEGLSCVALDFLLPSV